jgi:hypothetical protein
VDQDLSRNAPWRPVAHLTAGKTQEETAAIRRSLAGKDLRTITSVNQTLMKKPTLFLGN